MKVHSFTEDAPVFGYGDMFFDDEEEMGGPDGQPALVASLPEPLTRCAEWYRRHGPSVSAHSGDGQAQGCAA
jgi:hypothetical protein